jgi:hypothetical protein
VSRVIEPTENREPQQRIASPFFNASTFLPHLSPFLFTCLTIVKVIFFNFLHLKNFAPHYCIALSPLLLSSNMSAADFETDSRHYDGKQLEHNSPASTHTWTDDRGYERDDRSPRGDLRTGGDSRARSASPDTHGRGDR